MTPKPAPSRYASAQKGRTLSHPSLPQNEHERVLQLEHSFVVCADTQFGMTTMNRDWEAEKEYSARAIEFLNKMDPPPLFCCVCGDLVDMVASLYPDRSESECDRIQDEQNRDFKLTWDALDTNIPLVCLCGNHDVGNCPTGASIQRFASAFGDDYLAFWANGTYHVAVNTSLFADPSGAPEMYEEQLAWLEQRLTYAESKKARNIFVFGHHPWFLYTDKETQENTKGMTPNPMGSDYPSIADSYFHIPIKYRAKVLRLFERYNVSAAFAGHFHQNLVSTSSFGMPMVVTGPLSVILRSTGIPKDFDEPRTRGLRIVTVQPNSGGGRGGQGKFQHKFVSL